MGKILYSKTVTQYGGPEKRRKKNIQWKVCVCVCEATKIGILAIEEDQRGGNEKARKFSYFYGSLHMFSGIDVLVLIGKIRLIGIVVKLTKICFLFLEFSGKVWFEPSEIHGKASGCVPAVCLMGFTFPARANFFTFFVQKCTFNYWMSPPLPFPVYLLIGHPHHQN